ncbi:hypothetical protein AB6806_26775 [Bosea sp. RCC_152_1]|uniref:hypothetical protein n=1 Tax=Bosea sp. RCC_152_1 TaxID=3239228 RepID=UPI0035265AA5
MEANELRQEDLASAHAAGSAAAALFEETLNSLIKETTSVDALEILARAGFSVILRGVRPEEQQIGKPGLQLFHLELIQALALSRGRSSPVSDTDYPGNTQRVIDLIAENSRAYCDRAKSKMSADAAANRRQNLLARIQEWTLIVRGARQGFQTREYATDLAKAINPTFRHHIGCDATEVVVALSTIIETTKHRLRGLMDEARAWSQKKTGISMIEAFVQRLPPELRSVAKEKALPFRNDRRRLRAYLWSHNEHRLREIFTFKIEDLTAAAPPAQKQYLSEVITALSLKFGAVTPADLEHLHLSNPVQLKPLIQLAEGIIFCAAPQVISAHFAEILEALCTANPKLKKASEKARG